MIWVRRILAFLTLAPLALWLSSIAIVLLIGAVAGCTIDEGSVHSCGIWGINVGGIAYSLGVFAAWGPLIFLPLVLVAGILWAVLAIIARLGKKR